MGETPKALEELAARLIDAAVKRGEDIGFAAGRDAAATKVQRRAEQFRARGQHATADNLQQISVDIMTTVKP